jgi:cutinase
VRPLSPNTIPPNTSSEPSFANTIAGFLGSLGGLGGATTSGATGTAATGTTGTTAAAFPALPALAGTASSVANDVLSGTCAPVTLIFARGTTEPSNLGTVVGPPLASAMAAAFPAGVAVQGVDYPADVAGAETGALQPAQAQGALTMANLTQQALAACPQTQVVLAGYSQGAEQVHGALENLQQGQVAVCSSFQRLLTSVG